MRQQSGAFTRQLPSKSCRLSFGEQFEGRIESDDSKKNYASIRKKLWGAALWSPSYFAGSCGGAPISIIRPYIEQQLTPL